MENKDNHRSFPTTAEKREQNRIRVQIDILKQFLKRTTRGIGFCVDIKTVYLMIGTDICYKIPAAKFLLDPKKLPKARLIRIKMYKDLFEKSQTLKRVHYRKQIRDESYSVFRLGDKQICVPYDRMKEFGWKGLGFYGIDEFSPVFISDKYSKEWKRIQGFVMPVPVSINVLKSEEPPKPKGKRGRPRKNPIVKEKNDVNI